MIAAGWSPSVRLFEAAACATPVISDAWPGLDELFPEDEAIRSIARRGDDVVSALCRIDEAARAMGKRARRIVSASHQRRRARAGAGRGPCGP